MASTSRSTAAGSLPGRSSKKSWASDVIASSGTQAAAVVQSSVSSTRRR